MKYILESILIFAIWIISPTSADVNTCAEKNFAPGGDGKRREHMSKVRQKQIKRRAEIIEALIPVISSRDFSELSVGELCEAAGISVGSFYHYFSKKSDILVGLLSLIDEHLEEHVYAELTRGSARENLLLFAHEWAEYVCDHGLERSKLISATAASNDASEFSGRS